MVKLSGQSTVRRQARPRSLLPPPPPGWRVGEWLRARGAACAVSLEPPNRPTAASGRLPTSPPSLPQPPLPLLPSAPPPPPPPRSTQSIVARAHSWRAVTAAPPMPTAQAPAPLVACAARRGASAASRNKQGRLRAAGPGCRFESGRSHRRKRRPCSPLPSVPSPSSPGKRRHRPRSQLHRIRAQRRRQRQRCNYLLHSSTPFHFQVPLAVKPRLYRNHTGIFLKRLLFVHKCGLFHCHPDGFSTQGVHLLSDKVGFG